MSETSSRQAGHPGAVRRERDERIDALVVRVRAQAGSAQADSLERCVRELLRQHDDDDIAAASPDDLLGAVLSLWQHGARRTPGAPKVRVLNPSVSDSGWASRHTVIEIVNDDMPFLVDSTAMAINSQGLTLHLIAHPVFAHRGRPHRRPEAPRRAGGRAGAYAGRSARRGDRLARDACAPGAGGR